MPYDDYNQEIILQSDLKQDISNPNIQSILEELEDRELNLKNNEIQL